MPSAAALKWGALAIFIFQNAGVVLLMKLSRNVPGTPYSTRVAVLVQEGVKLLLSMGLYMHETGGPLEAIRAIRADLRENAMEWVQLGIPAVLYTVQNNCLFIGLSHLDAAVAHVTYQTKILFTALFSIALLGKQLGLSQWAGLSSLVLGVISVQGILSKLLEKYAAEPARGSGMAGGRLLSSPYGAGPKMLFKGHGSKGHPGHPPAVPPPPLLDRQLAAGAGAPAAVPPSAHAMGSDVALGIVAMLTAALCTSFASVYFERMLKGSRKPSLWLRNIQLAIYYEQRLFTPVAVNRLRNIQLAIYCGLVATATVLQEEDAARASEGWLHGFGAYTWATVMMNVAGGLLVAITIKYADNIVRETAPPTGPNPGWVRYCGGMVLGARVRAGGRDHRLLRRLVRSARHAPPLAVGGVCSHAAAPPRRYFLFDFQITPTFVFGVCLVGLAILLYGERGEWRGPRTRHGGGPRVRGQPRCNRRGVAARHTRDYPRLPEITRDYEAWPNHGRLLAASPPPPPPATSATTATSATSTTSTATPTAASAATPSAVTPTAASAATSWPASA